MKNRYRDNLENLRFAPVRLAIGSLALLLASIALVSAQDIDFSATVDRNNVGLGESISLTIKLSGGMRSIPKPTLPDLSDFDVYSSGTSSSLVMGTGGITNQASYSYSLVPRKVGTFTIQPATVNIGGKTYSTQPIQITVSQSAPSRPPQQAPTQGKPQSKQADSGDIFFVEQVVDNPNPFVGQQVIMTLSFYQAQDLFQQPSLQWPDYNGFWVEDLPPNRTYTTVIGNRRYRVTEIKRALFPTVSGKLTIEPSVVTIPPDALNGFFDDPFGIFGRRSRPVSQQQVLRSKKIYLDVKPLPLSGKPADFSGAVGKFNLKVTSDKSDVEVDQPVSLKAILSGTGNIKKLSSINISKLDNFRLYDSGSNENISKNNYTVSGSKDYEWVLIPTAPGEYELPEVSFSYFDPSAQQYKVLTQRPGKVNVRPSSSPSTSSPGAIAKNIIPAAKSSLNYIVTDLSKSTNGPPLYENDLIWALQLLPIGWLIFLAVRVNQRRRMEGDIAYARRKSASKAARKALQAARDGFGNPRQFFGLLYNGVVGFISDKLNVNAAGLTNDEIIQLLKQTGRCDDMIDEFTGFLNDCDAGRYSPVEPQLEQMKANYERAEQLLSTLDRSLR